MGALAREVEGRVAPPQRIGGSAGRRVRQHRKDEPLGVPERVSVVAGAGQALGADRTPFGPGSGLQRVEEREPHRLLELGIAVDLHVGSIPEVLEVGALALEQAFPARVPRLGQGCDRQVSDGRQ